MGREYEVVPDGLEGELCDTIFYQGNGMSQTHVLRYVGDQHITATTNEQMWCVGRNNLAPLNVIYKPHIGTEIADVSLNPFPSYLSMLNPLNLLGAAVSYSSNKYYGYHFEAPMQPSNDSVRFHAPNLSQFSIGQETDMQSHRSKYDSWLQKEDRSKSLILWGVSRGTAATFCAYTKEQYPEVKLVVLEGAIDSIQEVLPRRVSQVVKSDYLATKINSAITSGFSFFKRHNITQYDPEGPSPLKSVEHFPENTPVVFITSEVDKVVNPANTENIARALADRGKNDVYLLKLKRSSHPLCAMEGRRPRRVVRDSPRFY